VVRVTDRVERRSTRTASSSTCSRGCTSTCTTRSTRARSCGRRGPSEDHRGVARPAVVLAPSPCDRGNLVVDVVCGLNFLAELQYAEVGVSHVSLYQFVSEQDTAALLSLEEFVTVECELDVVVANEYIVESRLECVGRFSEEVLHGLHAGVFKSSPGENWGIGTTTDSPSGPSLTTAPPVTPQSPMSKRAFNWVV
jgi:hypothetical protein